MSKPTLAQLLKALVDQDGSDLHISPGVPPEMRLSGRMTKVKMDPLTAVDTKELCYQVINDSQKAELEKNWDLDFSFGIKDVARFRGNIMHSKGNVAGVFRTIPMKIPSFDQLKLPPILKTCLKAPNGLILVTGPTGSGKSTSLAAMIDYVNQEEFGHILTFEDPIEFVHPHKNCLVNQREIHSDTKSWHEALRRALRQDPDYILVGELRDAETIEMALSLAETGHLVFGTLHTNGAVQTINRIVNVFPPHQQPQIRSVLAFTLQAIMSQNLIPNSFGPGRSVAKEILIPTAAIRNLIREDKLQQVYSSMQSGQGTTGMCTLNQSLVLLVKEGKLSKEHALGSSTIPEELEKQLAGVQDKKTG